MTSSKLKTISFHAHPCRVTSAKVKSLTIYKAFLSLQICLLNPEALIFKLANLKLKTCLGLQEKCGFNSLLTDTVFCLLNEQLDM